MNTNTPKPPKVVVAPEGCNEYLTAGKEYPVAEICDGYSETFGYGFAIINDYGEYTGANEISSAHLKGGNWIIKEREQ